MTQLKSKLFEAICEAVQQDRLTTVQEEGTACVTVVLILSQVCVLSRCLGADKHHSVLLSTFDLQALQFSVACRAHVVQDTWPVESCAIKTSATRNDHVQSSTEGSQVNTSDETPLLGIYIGRSVAYITAVLACLAAG